MLNVSDPSADQLFAIAFAHHQAGRLAEAEPLYRQVLAQQPAHADALHLLGVLACQVNQYEPAIALMERAIELNPLHPAYHSNLGEACRKTGQPERAERHLRRALELDPRFADAYVNLAAVLMAQNRDAEAAHLLRLAAAQFPAHARMHRMLGDSLGKQGLTLEAIAAYQQTLLLDPALTEARHNLGVALLAQGHPEEAQAAFAAVLAAQPEENGARLLLAEALSRLGKTHEALAQLQAVIDRNPASAEAFAGLGSMLRTLDRTDEAIDAFRKSLELRPLHAPTLGNLALALRDQGRLAECIAMLRHAVEKQPDSAVVRSALIFSMLLDPDTPPEEIAAEKMQWNKHHVDTAAGGRRPHANNRSPDRRLRIGYVSADLRLHPVGRFLFPLLPNHDRTAVEVFCYSATPNPDGVTEQLRKTVDQWRQISAMSDEAAAALIRADGIDVLVDLSNHTIGNRLTLFACKPAPVQITYLAYCAGTGLSTMDWRLTDAWIDPPGDETPDSGDGAPDNAPFERPLRLAETYWCYAPYSDVQEANALPAMANGHITFGSFNFFSKVNDRVLELWATLLARLPTSRLALHVLAGTPRHRVQNFFADRGIHESRLTLIPRVDEKTYFQQYGTVDIALDPFPWAGGTTTCDALWMGVPVITLAGHGGTLSRCGASILSNLGYPEWIAASPEEYIAKALALAADTTHLAELRATLRPLMRGSVLMNGPRFARYMEQAYRRAWIDWCTK